MELNKKEILDVKSLLEEDFGHQIEIRRYGVVVCVLCDSHFMQYGGTKNPYIMIWENSPECSYDRWYCCWRINGLPDRPHTCKELTIRNIIE